MKEAPWTEAKVLIIDDEPANVLLLRRVLENAGFREQRGVTDSREAIAAFESFRPDIILLDLSMPHVDGYELLGRFDAAFPKGGYLPILVLTADATDRAKQRALSSGAHDFITKPFNNVEVVLRVANLLETRRLHLQLSQHNEALEMVVGARTAELRRALDELRATQQQVIQQERMRALGVMAGGVAHDMNNALSVILGFGELALARCEDEPDAHGQAVPLRAIVMAAEDASRMVNRLREFNRPEAAEINQLIDLNALARQAIALTEPRWKTQALASGINIDVELEESAVPFISGDPPELREALTNLIFNAVDAMPEGGAIRLRTRAAGGGTVLEVSDTGIGMSEEVRQRCLEPFFTTKGERGTGLGLAMVYGILQRHGASVAIESASGQGTKFIFEFPAAPTPDSASAAPLAVMLDEPLSILVVDDQEVLRDIIGQYLQQDWHVVETAGSGAEALEKFRAGHFDVVITDQAMPQMNGDQLIAAIRELAPAQRILMLTGFGAPDDASASPMGADLVVAKPVSKEALRLAVARLMTSLPASS